MVAMVVVQVEGPKKIKLDVAEKFRLRSIRQVESIGFAGCQSIRVDPIALEGR